MVATKLHQVTNKGLDWAYRSSPTKDSSKNVKDSNNSKSTWSYATNSLQEVYDQEIMSEDKPGDYNTVDNESYWSHATTSLQEMYDQAQTYFYQPIATTFMPTSNDGNKYSVQLYQMVSTFYNTRVSSSLFGSDWSYYYSLKPISSEPVLSSIGGSSGDLGNMNNNDVTTSSKTLLSKKSYQPFKYDELGLLWKNPSRTVMGIHQYSPYSLGAVRSLLIQVDRQQQQQQEKEAIALSPVESTIEEDEVVEIANSKRRTSREWTSNSLSDTNESTPRKFPTGPVASNAETASQLAEGSIRALRDLALEEAVELHGSLRFWTIRWESPLLSWLEAGPTVWFSSRGYDHQVIGQKVSQIQAVLARRCAAIGELQEHLLRASWSQGVASWGVLGQGGQWHKVVGGDGRIDDRISGQAVSDVHSIKIKNSSERYSVFDVAPDVSQTISDESLEQGSPVKGENIGNVLKESHPSNLSNYENSKITVEKSDGGEILNDDHALAGWSVDAISLVRCHLYRSGLGTMRLPCTENWQGEGLSLPTWATQADPIMRGNEKQITRRRQEIVISDLPLMAKEVSELLNSMEIIMKYQRNRRLEKLKIPPRIRRHWYMVSFGLPLSAYIVNTLIKDGKGMQLAKLVVDKLADLFKEHVEVPLKAVYYELFTRRARVDMSDRKARLEAIESCKKMIRSWLDETYPTMDENERQARADAMDMSLIEKRKEESIKTIYEVTSVVRMSLIEMQFIKKEMMNALNAMDEMMAANEINMNLAAVTPAVLAIYAANRIFRLLFYVLLKIGRSREETYASFRQVVLDIERLLLMRDNPPGSPKPIRWGERNSLGLENSAQLSYPSSDISSCRALCSDDLGMLMLLIHECRLILWREQRRFSSHIVRNVSEDLAELAGERGAVSVQQQLQIISRMCRTYPFLKVISTGFDFSRTIVTPSN